MYYYIYKLKCHILRSLYGKGLVGVWMAAAGKIAKYISIVDYYLSAAAGVVPTKLSSVAMDVKMSITEMYL